MPIPPTSLDCMLALATLTPLQREAWIDHRLAGLTRQQIAARDHVTVEAVRQRIATADVKLALHTHQPRALVAA